MHTWKHTLCPSCFSSGTIKDDVLTIGSVSAPIYNPGEKIKVPDVLFYENPQVITLANHRCNVCCLLCGNINQNCKPKDDNSAPFHVSFFDASHRA